MEKKQFKSKEKVYTPLDLDARKDHLIQCPSCQSIVDAADINLDKMLARCGSCNSVFDFQQQVKPALQFPETKPPTLIPEGLEVLKLSSELDIRLNWRKSTSKGGIGFLLLFTTIWNAILLPFVGVAVATGEYQILLFTSVHMLIGLGFLYHLASVFMNTTSVNITRRKIEVSSGPLPSPFRKDREIDATELEQLYVSKYTASTTNGNPNYAYALYAILRHGRKIRLIKGMNKETQVYLEKEIEKFLEIENVVVEGEIGRA